jgi:hypothetical protein
VFGADRLPQLFLYSVENQFLEKIIGQDLQQEVDEDSY